MEICPEYRIYFAAQKVAQLYRQLPEACVAAGKASANRSSRHSLDLQRLPPDEAALEKGSFFPNHFFMEGSDSSYGEALFDKNESFQLRRVLRCLRRAGALGCAAIPGRFVEFCEAFTSEDSAAPENGVLLRSAGLCRGRELRLFCEPDSFHGADYRAACLFAWGGGGAVPLGGVMLCLTANERSAAGLPLYLAVRNAA